MTSRERFLAAVEQKPIDKIPFDMTISIEAYNNLIKHLDVKLPEITTCGINCMVYPEVAFYEALGIDVMYLKIGAPKGVKAFTFGDPEVTNEFGLTYRKLVTASGLIDYEPVNTPFKDFTVEDLDRFPWPDPLDERIHAGLRERAEAILGRRDMAIGGYFFASLFTTPSLLRGMGQWLMDLLINEDFARRFMEILCDYYTKLYCKALDECGKHLSFVRLDHDDFGTQNGLLISRELFNRVVRPYEEKFCRAVKEHFLAINPDGKIMKHSCGDVLELVGDFIDMGIDILNPIQPRTKHMTRERLFKDYGGKIAFMGGIDTQVVLPQGKPADVEAEVKDAIEKLAGPSGYIVGPAHHVQADVPPENILAFARAVKKFGSFG